MCIFSTMETTGILKIRMGQLEMNSVGCSLWGYLYNFGGENKKHYSLHADVTTARLT